MNYYFLGIAGAGMSAVASILASRGHQVEGSDSGVFPPVSRYLDAQGIPWRDGFDAARLPERIDEAVIGGSAKLGLADNPELAELKRRGVPLTTFPALLGREVAGRETILVAGSFGKSTLTALIAHLIKEAGGDPGWFVGAAPLDLPANGHWGHDPAFILEGDEYIVGDGDRRPKFLLYEASRLVITSLVHDHLNVFPQPADYEAAFAALLSRNPETPLFCARGYESLQRLTAGRAVVWYGLEAGPGWSAADIRIGERSAFAVVDPAGGRITVETGLIGRHNFENILGAAAVLLGGGMIDADAFARGVARFRGLERRLDRKPARSSIVAFEGFGSSYEKARSAIEAVRLHFPARPLAVIFEPHAFTWRRRAGLGWYDTAFDGADFVALLPPPGHGADGEQAGGEEILARIRAAGVAAALAEDGEAALDLLGGALRPDSAVLLLSSGPLDGLPERLPAWLETRFPA